MLLHGSELNNGLYIITCVSKTMKYMLLLEVTTTWIENVDSVCVYDYETGNLPIISTTLHFPQITFLESFELLSEAVYQVTNMTGTRAIHTTTSQNKTDMSLVNLKQT